MSVILYRRSRLDELKGDTFQAQTFVLFWKNPHGGSYPAALTLQKHVALSCQSHWHRPPDSENLGCLPQIQAVCNVGVNGTRCSIWLQAAEGYAAHECAGSHPGRKHTNGPELTRFFFFVLCFLIYLFPPLLCCRLLQRCLFGFGDESDVVRAARHLLLLPGQRHTLQKWRQEAAPSWGRGEELQGSYLETGVALTATVYLTGHCTRRPVSAPVMLSGHSAVDTGRVIYPVNKGSRVRNVFYSYILIILTLFTSASQEFLFSLQSLPPPAQNYSSSFFSLSFTKFISVSLEFINLTHNFKVLF